MQVPQLMHVVKRTEWQRLQLTVSQIEFLQYVCQVGPSVHVQLVVNGVEIQHYLSNLFNTRAKIVLIDKVQIR